MISDKRFLAGGPKGIRLNSGPTITPTTNAPGKMNKKLGPVDDGEKPMRDISDAIVSELASSDQ